MKISSLYPIFPGFFGSHMTDACLSRLGALLVELGFVAVFVIRFYHYVFISRVQASNLLIRQIFELVLIVLFTIYSYILELWFTFAKDIHLALGLKKGRTSSYSRFTS